MLEHVVMVIVEMVKNQDLVAKSAQLAFTVISKGAEWAAFGIQLIVAEWHGLRVVVLSVAKFIVDRLLDIQTGGQYVATYIARAFDVAFNGIMAGLSYAVDAIADLVISAGHSVRTLYDDEMGFQIEQMGMGLRLQAEGQRRRFGESLDSFADPVKTSRTVVNDVSEGLGSALKDAQSDFAKSTATSWSANARDAFEANASLPQEIAKAVESGVDASIVSAGPGASGVMTTRSRRERARDALVVDLSRVAIGGNMPTAEERQISLLEQIAQNTRGVGRYG
jgi:hypothetical protein